MGLAALGSCVAYRLCQIAFIIAQILTWYIQLSFILVTVVHSNVEADNPFLNKSIKALNLIVHIVFTGLLHVSHWRVACSDPGYVNNEYECTKLEEQEGNGSKWEVVAKRLPVKESAPKPELNGDDEEAGITERLLKSDESTSASSTNTLVTTGR